MKKLLIGLLAIMILISAVGCGKKETPKTSESTQAGLNGSITLVGSDSMQNVVGALADEFEAKNPNAKIQVQGGGSGASFEPVRKGIAQLGLVSRKLKTEENDLKTIQIAFDGIAFAVNKNNPVENLTKDQLAKIYAGEITNWKDVGGKDMKITVISREAGSGTTGTFEDIIMKKAKKEIAPSVLRINQSEGIKATVAKSEGTIGFFSLYLADETVKKLKIEGVEATEDNVKNSSYALSRPFNFTYKTEPTGVAKAFIDFALSPEGQKIVADEKLITLK